MKKDMLLKNKFKPGVYLLRLLILASIGYAGCKKLVEVAPPSTSVTGASAYAEDGTATAVLTGIYGSISDHNTAFPGDISSLTLFPGMSSDELTYATGLTNTRALAYYRNSLVASSANATSFGSEYWRIGYGYIFRCNDAIAGLNVATKLTPSVKQQLLGEAKFMRAFFYFYLVNLYGDVPLALTNDYKINSSLPRAPKAQVYQQIISDLKDAQTLLSGTYLDGTLKNPDAERVRPTKWAAAALLARAYLYYGNLSGDPSSYTNAETEAGLLINNSSLFSLSALSNTFLRYSAGNNEAIWQLQPVETNINSWDAQVFIITTLGPGKTPNYGAYASDYLLNSFEAGDQRKATWIGSVIVGSPATTYYFPYKYKVPVGVSTVTEFPTILRLGEQYLIRAEAKAQLGESNAIDDLNTIRTRAGLANYAGATDKTSLLAAILHERQVELFAEFGHRWFDLKRTGNLDVVMGAGGVCAAKGGTWSTNWQYYPIPLGDLQKNTNLTQNPGY